MARRRVTQTPHVFLAVCHRDYEAEAKGFVKQCEEEQFDRYFERAVARGDIQALDPRGDRSEERMPLVRLIPTLTLQIKEALRIKEGNADAVFRMIRILGLWGRPTDREIKQADNPKTKQMLRDIRRGRNWARAAVDCWQIDATAGGPEERRRARALLRRVGEALLPIPETRGRVGKVSNFVISATYWQEVFRWRQIRHVVECWPGTRREQVDAVCQAYDLASIDKRARALRRLDPTKSVIPDKQLLAYMGRHPDGTRTKTRPLKPEKIAQLIVAKTFNLDPRRVANVISDYPRHALQTAELMLK
jgi:hypothetical protein